MSILKRLALLSLVGFVAKAFACEPIIEAWEDENYQGEHYQFGKNCAKEQNWNDEFSSIKVHKDYVMRACEHSYKRGACMFVTGNVPKLDDYRPTGINLDNSISSFESEYQPKSKITIAAFFDAPDQRLSGVFRYNKLFTNLLHAHQEVERIKRIIRDSGLNVDVDVDYQRVSNSDAKMINEAVDALATFQMLYGDAKKDHTYGLYFPSKSPIDSKNGLDSTGEKPTNNWDGRARVSIAETKRSHLDFLTEYGFGIVIPNAPAFVGAHEWGHLAGLHHVVGGDYGIKRYGVGHLSTLFGQVSFSTVMNAANQIANKTHLLFSSPKIQCSLPGFHAPITWYNTLSPISLLWRKTIHANDFCGKANESDARRALLETVLKWHTE